MAMHNNSTSNYYYGDPYSPRQDTEIHVPSDGSPTAPATTVLVPYHTQQQQPPQQPYPSSVNYSSPYAVSSPTMSNYDSSPSSLAGSSVNYSYNNNNSSSLDPFSLGVNSPPPPTTDNVNAPFAAPTTNTTTQAATTPTQSYYTESTSTPTAGSSAVYPETAVTTSASYDYSEQENYSTPPPQRPPTATATAMGMPQAPPSGVPRPDFERMKKARVRGQIAAGTVGAVGGLILLGPIGALALGVAGNKVTKAVTKRREKKLKDEYAAAVLQEQHAAAPPLHSEDAVLS